MKKTQKLLTLVMSVVLAFCLVLGLVACSVPRDVGGEYITPEIPDDQKVNPPAEVSRVYSVTIMYNDNAIDGGVLSVDKSAGTINVTANVVKDADADGAVVFDSSDKNVATITAAGAVTLLEKGETVLSATAGGKSHSVVLVVNDTHAETGVEHNITVNGGTANVAAARAGEYVTLAVEVPKHKDFTGWRFPNTVTWISGNVFKMPDRDVEIVAEFTDMLYELNVVGAKIVKADAELDPEGMDGGHTNDGNTAEYAITKYLFPYNTTIDVEAIAEPAGKIFVGWDNGSQDNRAGENGVPSYSFETPDKTHTVWAIFGELKTKVLTAGGIGDVKRSEAITNGKVPGEDFPDKTFEGLCGYRITIGAGATTADGYTNENIQGSDLNSIETGTRLMKAIYRNNSEGTVTVEIYASYYGILASSGRVTIAGGETKKVFFTAGMGIDKPWMGFAVRENNSSTDVVLDMVLGSTTMYPKGDKSLAVTGGPQYVKLKDASKDFIYKNANPTPFENNGWQRERCLANKVGAIYVANYAHSGCYNNPTAANPTYLSAPIVNMPAYDAENPKGIIYGKYLNLALNPEVSIKTTLKLVICKTANPMAAGSIVASVEIDSDSIGDMKMFKLEWDRVEGQNYYFAILKEKLDATGTYDANSFCIQMVYNNCIGYEED